MKRCPSCDRTYQDDNQKFCTHDGGRLVFDSQAPTSLDLNATLRADASDLTAPTRPPTPTTPTPPAPPAPDLNATIAAYPPQPPPQDFRGSGSDTGPTNSGPTSSTLILPSNLNSSTSAPLPQVPSAPLPPSPSAPSPSAPLPQAAAAPPMQSAQPARKSKLPMILGILGGLCLLFIAAVAIVFFTVIKPRMEAVPTRQPIASGNANANTNTNINDSTNTNNQTRADTNSNANSTANANANAGSSEVVPPNSTKFVNSRAKLDGKLAEHYVDFSFYYPNTWKLDPGAGVPGASNFVKVDRFLPPDFTQERLIVSWYESGGTFESDRSKFPDLVESFSAKLSKSLPAYEKVSEGPTKVNSRDGYEFRFQGLSKGTEKGDVSFWGRVIFLPPAKEGDKNGVTLLMLTSSLAPELTSVSDVGAKGGLPLILDSFKFGS